MKNRNTVWLLTLFISLGGFDVLADSSKISSYVFTADGMHLQEVLLHLEINGREQEDCYYLVKKSQDGVDYQTIAELEDIKLIEGTIILADHLRVNENTYYQLVRIDAKGESIVASTSFDPNASTEEGDLIGMSNNPLKSATFGDPHNL